VKGMTSNWSMGASEDICPRRVSRKLPRSTYRLAHHISREEDYPRTDLKVQNGGRDRACCPSLSYLLTRRAEMMQTIGIYRNNFSKKMFFQCACREKEYVLV
jgi:hypothetical protein